MDASQQPPSVSVNFFTTNEQYEMDKRAMNALLRKIDMRLMPWLILLYFFSYLDRINIGNARLFGIENDLHLSLSEFNWAISIFFIPYILCEVPSNLLMRRFGPSRWIGTLMLVWGVITILMAFVRNADELLTTRFLLGVAEAGFFPGALFYLSLWYIRKDQALRITILFSAAMLAGAFGGILLSTAYGIGQLGKLGGLAGWQWIFLAEGVPTICIAIATYKLLADYPATVQWLDQCNKDILTARLRADVKMIGDADKEASSYQIRLAFLDWKVWLYMLINIGGLTPVYGLSLFLPSIIKDMGFENAIAQLLTAPPYVVACAITIVCTWNASRLNERSNHILIFLLIGIGGFLYLILAKKFLYIGVFITCIGVFTSNALIPSWITNNIGGQTKRAVAIALAASSGNVGGILSGQIYRVSDAPYYRQGHYIILGIMCCNFILVLLLKLLLTYENKRRSNLSPEEREKEIAEHQIHSPFDKHPDFVYIT